MCLPWQEACNDPRWLVAPAPRCSGRRALCCRTRLEWPCPWGKSTLQDMLRTRRGPGLPGTCQPHKGCISLTDSLTGRTLVGMRLGSFLLDTCTLVRTLCGEEKRGGRGRYGRLEFASLNLMVWFVYLSMFRLGLCKSRSHKLQLT